MSSFSSIKNVTINRETTLASFTVDIGDGLDLLNSLEDVRSSLEDAYEAAKKLISVFTKDVPSMRWNGYEWVHKGTNIPIKSMREDN